uniref:Ovule protein n=1 Tax=Anisakis simplex TaxID=6269 RepID=A0A0M3JKF0_ANISI
LHIVKARWNCTRQCTVRVQCVSQRRCAFSTLIRSARYQRLNRLSPKINTCKPMTQVNTTNIFKQPQRIHQREMRIFRYQSLQPSIRCIFFGLIHEDINRKNSRANNTDDS